MAVDSAAKRYSMIGLSCEVIDPALIVPDGSMTQGDRQALIWGYSGITWDELNITWYLYMKSRFRSTLDIETSYRSTVEMKSRYRNTVDITSRFY